MFEAIRKEGCGLNGVSDAGGREEEVPEGVCPSVRTREAVSFPGCPIVYQGAYFGVEVHKTIDDVAHAVQVSCASSWTWLLSCCR